MQSAGEGMRMCSAASLSYNVSVNDCGCIKLRGSIGGLLLDKCERLAVTEKGKKWQERMKRDRTRGTKEVRINEEPRIG